jgi:DNA-binding transcriptional regulator LsrR (DeoR family)
MLRHLPDLRLMTRVARLYHEERLIQSEIASKLGITQVAVSRLLKKAEENGIVRTTVVTPPGAWSNDLGFLRSLLGKQPVTQKKRC